MKRGAGRAFVIGSLLAATSTSRAFAEETSPEEQHECARAYETAQELRLANRALSAREQLRICGRESCKEFMYKACNQWLGEVNATIASVAFVAYRGEHPITELQVLDNGVRLPIRADGDPVEVDPGEHLFEMQISGAAPVQRRVTLQSGERNRLVRVIFPEPAAQPPAVPTPSSPPRDSLWPHVFLGVGTLGVASFAVLGMSGLNREDDLRSQCAPNCASRDVSSVRSQYLAADIALGVGVVALATGTILWLLEPPNAERSAAGRWRLGLTPSPFGATGRLERTF